MAFDLKAFFMVTGKDPVEVIAVPDKATVFTIATRATVASDHRLGRRGRRREDDRGSRMFAAAMRPFSTGVAYVNFTPAAAAISRPSLRLRSRRRTAPAVSRYPGRPPYE